MRRGFFVIICVLILLALNSIYILTTVDILADTNMKTFSDGSTEKVKNVPDSSTSFELEVPINASIIQATMNISLLEHNNKYPYNPVLSMGTSNTGGSKTLWRYKGTGYGSLGHQENFKGGSTQKEIIYK